MEPFLTHQRGYLMVIAIIIIVIVGFAAGMLAYMFVGQSTATSETLQAKSALYIAASGLEIAKRDLVVNGVQCTTINGTTKYTNAALFNGQFTIVGDGKIVVGMLNQNITNSTSTIPLAYTTLSTSITADATTIPLVNATILPSSGTVNIDKEMVSYTSISGNALQNVMRGTIGTAAASHANGTMVMSGFSNNGVIWIDSELINYAGIDGNVLQNAKRGSFGTAASAHLAGAVVSQNQCVLTATGGVPTIAATADKRTLQQVLPGAAFSTGGGSLISSTLVSIGTVQMSGTSFVINPSVTASSENFPGSTITSASTVSIIGASGTKISDGSNLIQSSGAGNINADIQQNNSTISSNISSPDYLFNKFFSSPPDTGQALVNDVKATANVVINSNPATIANDLNNVNNYGKTVWVNGGIQLTGNQTITVGSPSKPVILIIDGGVQLTGSPALSLNVYGLLYVRGSVQLGGAASIGGRGSVAVEGSTQLSGTDSITFDPSIINQLGPINPLMASHYVGSPVYTQEIFK